MKAATQWKSFKDAEANRTNKDGRKRISKAVSGDPATVKHTVYRKVDPKVEFATGASTVNYLAKCGLFG